jgi:2-polyprenyl-3-methyl-5-hydroxy-6-metoxy-1,4-benzoquinol methylase
MAKVDKLAKMRHRYTAKFIAKRIPDGARVLEIGGTKQAAYWLLAKKKYDLVTVNKVAPADYELNIEKDSLEELDENFRYVTMFEVVEHLENPMWALRNIRNIMEKNALFLGSTPNRFDPYLFLGAKINEDHNYVFDALTIKHLLKNCGFEPIEVKSRVFPIKLYTKERLFIPIDLSKLIPTGRVTFWVATRAD